MKNKKLERFLIRNSGGIIGMIIGVVTVYWVISPIDFITSDSMVVKRVLIMSGLVLGNIIGSLSGISFGSNTESELEEPDKGVEE